MGKYKRFDGLGKTKGVKKNCSRRISYWFIGLWIIICFAVFGACGEKREQTEKGETVAISDEWVPIQVLDHAWKGFEKVEEAQEPWHPEDFQDGFGRFTDRDGNVLGQVPDRDGDGGGRSLEGGRDWKWNGSLYAWSGDLFYALSDYYAEGEETVFAFQLVCVDTVSMKETKVILDFPEALTLVEDGEAAANGSGSKNALMREEGGKDAIEGENTAIEEREWREFREDLKTGRVRAVSMDALEERLYLFFAHYDGDWTLKHYYLVETGMDLKIQKVTDFSSQLIGEEQSDYSAAPEGYLSKDGEICFVDTWKKQLTLINAQGEVKGRMDLQSIRGDIRIGLIGRAQDGTPVFQAMDWNGGVTWFTPEAILYGRELFLSYSSLDDAGGMLLWQDSDLVRWNVETGEARKLCPLNGLQASYCMGIRKNSAGQIVLAYDEGDSISFCRYAAGARQDGVTLRIGMFFVDPYLQSAAADYERTHPGTAIEFVEFENPFQNATSLNRLAEECKAGEGPDMIRFTTQEQIDILQQAGCLAPMEGMLSEETRNGLFGCVLELGKTEGGIYGIPYSMYLRGYMTSGENEKRNAWTAREMMESYQEVKAKNADMRFLGASYPQSSQNLLYELCLLNLDDSPFVDFEKGSCSFDSQEFCDLLRFCRENAEKQGSQEYYQFEETISQMRSGQAFLYCFSGGLTTYSKARSELGKDFYPIGAATESKDALENGGFLAVSSDFLTMNAFSENRELAANFLEYLLSERCQVRYGVWSLVRKDVIESHVRERVHIEMTMEDGSVLERTECRFVLDKRSAMPLAVDENGDSFVKEYIAIMDGASIYSSHPEIRAIVSEEADAYFNGAKTAQEVAHLIQNRVELFLKE